MAKKNRIYLGNVLSAPKILDDGAVIMTTTINLTKIEAEASEYISEFTTDNGNVIRTITLGVYGAPVENEYGRFGSASFDVDYFNRRKENEASGGQAPAPKQAPKPVAPPLPLEDEDSELPF